MFKPRRPRFLGFALFDLELSYCGLLHTYEIFHDKKFYKIKRTRLGCLISPGRVNQGEVRPQGNQGMKGLGFSALRFDFKKKRRTFGNKK